MLLLTRSLYHVRHRIKPRPLSFQKQRRLQRSFSKDRLGIGRMAESYHLVLPGKNHLMLTDNCAAAYSLDPDFLDRKSVV